MADTTAVTQNGLPETSTDPGKLFIGGLSWQTTPDSLKSYFQKFGELKECFIMCDPVTRRSRGFGFVTFVNIEDGDKATHHEPHILDGKKIDPKKAFPKVPNSKFVTKTKKVFVGGIQHGTAEDDLKEYFENFGTVTEVVIMFDKLTTRCRGFGFVTFETEESVDHCCDERYHIVNNKRVECKKAQPKEVMFPPQGRGIYLGRGLLTRPGYVYSRADYSPLITGYFQPQFNPAARTRFVSPTPPRTRGYYGYDAFAMPAPYGAIANYGAMDRRGMNSTYLADYNQLAMPTGIPPTGLPRARELSSSPTGGQQSLPVSQGNTAPEQQQYPEQSYTHFSPMYSPFSASPSPSTGYRTANGPESMGNNTGLTMPSYTALAVSSASGTYQAGGAAVTAGNPAAPAYSSQPQRQF